MRTRSVRHRRSEQHSRCTDDILCVLLLLKEAPKKGRDLLSQLPDALPGCAEPLDAAEFYQVLRVLEKDGSVASTAVSAAAEPSVRVYALTEPGSQRLDGWFLQMKRDVGVMNRLLHAYDRSTAGSESEPHDE